VRRRAHLRGRRRRERLPNTVSPFDASIEEAGPGKGGCPVNETCRLQFTNLPAWYGACAYPDGG